MFTILRILIGSLNTAFLLYNFYGLTDKNLVNSHRGKTLPHGMLKTNPNLRAVNWLCRKRCNQSKHKNLSFRVNSLIQALCGFFRRYFIWDRPMSFPVWIQSGGTALMRFLAVHTIFLFHEHFILYYILYFIFI